MKSIIKKAATAFGIIVLFLSLSSPKAEAHPKKGISLQVFYDELSYYGDWVNNPDYGYVWRPDVGRDFRPYYTNGHWVMTEYGNTWVSDYEWGWAPFHYGRWFYDDYDGWIWAPDTEWGPAWVSWRTGGGYYGWAPLGPRVNINIGRRYYVPDNYWVFIPQRCIYYPSYSRYWEPRRNVYIVHNTTIINNIYTNRNVNYYTGPRADDIRRATRQDVPVYRVADDTKPGSTRVTRDAINIYRPDVLREDKNAAPRAIASNSRPSRAGDNNVGRSNDGSGNSAKRDDSNQSNRPSTIDRSARPDVSSRPQNEDNNRSARPDASPRPQNEDNSRSARPNASPSRTDVPTRTERSTDNSSSNQRSNNPAPAKQESRNDNSRPERVERSQPSTPRTEERSQPQQQQSSRSNDNSSKESNRPTRGNN